MLRRGAVRTYRDAERRFWEHYGPPPAERFVSLARPMVTVRVLEAGQGPPVLFVHGGPNAGSIWAPLAAQLAGFRCIVFDRPGCGLSDPLPGSTRDVRTVAVDVLTSLLDALAIERVSLVGSSFGGAWAFWMAQAQPERVSGVVQEGCPGFIAGSHQPPLFQMLLSTGALGRMLAGQRATSGMVRLNFRQMGHGVSLDAGRLPAVWLEWTLRWMNDTDTMRNEMRMYQGLSTWRGFRPELRYAEEFLRRIAQPALFLWGEADPFGSVAVGLRAAAAMPDATLQSFPTAGHLPWLDDPVTHADIVRDFLRRRCAC